jgi:hypothetical protein
MNLTQPESPEVFLQQNKSLPNFTFRGYATPGKLNYSTTIDPKVLQTAISNLDAAYNKGQAFEQESQSNRYKAFGAAPGDIELRNTILNQYDEEAKKIISKFTTSSGIAFENQNFPREVNALNLEFAKNLEIQKLGLTNKAYNNYDASLGKGENGYTNYKPYVDKNGKVWNTKENGVFEPDFHANIDYATPVLNLWGKVKADERNTSTIDEIDGTSTTTGKESTEAKIDALTDQAYSYFMQTPEGSLMFKELTTDHKKDGKWVDKQSEEDANNSIKQYVKDLSGFFKYTKESNSTKTQLPWQEQVELKKTYQSSDGKRKEVNEVTIGGVVDPHVSIRGNGYGTPEANSEYSAVALENLKELTKNFNAYNKENGDVMQLIADANGMPTVSLKDPSNKILIGKHKAQLDRFNVDMQLEHNVKVNLARFDNAVLKEAGLSNLSPAKKKELDEEYNKFMGQFRKSTTGIFDMTSNGSYLDAYSVAAANPELMNEIKEYKALHSNAEAAGSPLYTRIDAFLRKANIKDDNGVTAYLLVSQEMSEIKKNADDVNKELTEKLASSNNKNLAPYSKYRQLYSKQAEQKTVTGNEYNLDNGSNTKEVEAFVNPTIDRVLSGVLPIYLTHGNQDVPALTDEMLTDYKAAEKGKGHELKDDLKIIGWRFDDNDGLVATGTFKGNSIEVRPSKGGTGSLGLEAFVVAAGYDAALRIDQLRRIGQDFNISFGQEARLGIDSYDEKTGEQIQKSYKMEKLLFDDEAGNKEGTLKIDFDGTTEFADSYSEAIDKWILHEAKIQQSEQTSEILTTGDGVRYVKSGTGTTVDPSTYFNPYGIRPKGVKGYLVFANMQEGINKGIADIRAKVEGKSDAMKEVYGESYLTKKEDGTGPATLLDLIKVFAPPSDGNNPDTYADNIFKWTNGKYGPSTKLVDIKDIDLLAKMKLKQENYKVYKQIYPDDK